jgi:ABC-type amino acid transport substrate-binding protein
VGLLKKLSRQLTMVSVNLLICIICIGLYAGPSYGVEIEYFQNVLDRGYLKIGIPPYETPPYYYFDNNSNQMEGIDIDIVRKFANELGVKAVFDRDSKTYNGLLKRTGADEFDISIGKLSTFYKRMEDAHPHEYMSFRHGLLANRKVISRLQGQTPNEKFAPILLDSKIKVGFIKDSSYGEFANQLFPKATKLGLQDWPTCKKALMEGKVDAIYRDATEVKKIVYEEPNLSLNFVPVLFDDKIDHISMYVSNKVNPDLSSMLEYFITKEIGIKTDKEIMEEYTEFFQPSKLADQKS